METGGDISMDISLASIPKSYIIIYLYNDTEVCYESKQGGDISMDISLANIPKSYNIIYL